MASSSPEKIVTSLIYHPVPERYPVPRLQDFTTGLARATIFLKVDPICRYHQIPVHPINVPMMAITALISLWEFLQMPSDYACDHRALSASIIQDNKTFTPFASAEHATASAWMLSSTPGCEAFLTLQTDASDCGIGAVLD